MSSIHDLSAPLGLNYIENEKVCYTKLVKEVKPKII